MYKTGRYIVNWCVENNIELIIIGQNKGWKQESNNGPVNNQNFVRIPFDRLKKIIRYLGARQGLKVVDQEESYTSKASFPDNDFMPGYGKEDNVKPTFSGKRGPTWYHGHRKTQKLDPVTRERKTTNPEFRGLYEPQNKEFGEVINLDLNGSANIGRKYRADLIEIGQKPEFEHVIIIKHPDDVCCTAKESRKNQLKAREGMQPSKSKLRRQSRRERMAAERKIA